MERRVDIISDTHGYLAPELLRAIEGCDLLIHAGDITSESNYAELEVSVPVLRAVLGNNDGYYNYGPDVPRVNEFTYEGVRFSVAHYAEDLPLASSNVAVCGHTHRPRIDRVHGVSGDQSRVGIAAAWQTGGLHRTAYGRGRPRAICRDHRLITFF